uniref:RAB43, member RAS oncogene family n=1 Tax=Rousettus aegyptiacus TaxID=9407 RepID=A0A7J8DJU6_ROUAE|nr:RAB43, member RAS oncogene family [Rousettus aegyptiacus]
MAGPGPGPGDPDEQYDFLFKLVLVGDASVGKTCVVQRFKTGAFSERQSSTIGVDFTMKTLEIQGKRVKVGMKGRSRHVEKSTSGETSGQAF